MTRARKKNRRKQTRKKRGGHGRLGRLGSSLSRYTKSMIGSPSTVFNMNLTQKPMTVEPMTVEPMKPMTVEPMKLMTQEPMTLKPMTLKQPIIPKLITPEDVLKIMRENSISIEDLDNISNKTELVQKVGETVEKALSNKKSIDWNKIRDMQNKAYTAFTQINVFTHVWKKIVEDECNNKLSNEDKDKCFSIRGFVYISFMVFLIFSELLF